MQIKGHSRAWETLIFMLRFWPDQPIRGKRFMQISQLRDTRSLESYVKHGMLVKAGAPGVWRLREGVTLEDIEARYRAWQKEQD